MNEDQLYEDEIALGWCQRHFGGITIGTPRHWYSHFHLSVKESDHQIMSSKVLINRELNDLRDCSDVTEDELVDSWVWKVSYDRCYPC